MFSILKRRHHNQLCKGNKSFLGCNCGDFGKDNNKFMYGGDPFSNTHKKEDQSAQDAANGIQSAGQQLYDRSKQTPEEQAQYMGSFDIGKFLQQYFGYQTGMNAKPEGYKSPTEQYTQDNPLGQNLYNTALKDVQDPYASYESQLQPSLQQAQESINSYYQKRGLINSGIAIGDMGTAGVDLAIKEAQGRMNWRQQALANAGALDETIYGRSNKNMKELANLYGNQQNYGINTMNRQAQGATAAAGYQAYPYQAQLGSYYGGIAAQKALPGQLISSGAQLASAAAPLLAAA